MKKIGFTYIPFTACTMAPNTLEIMNQSEILTLEVDDKYFGVIHALLCTPFKPGKFDRNNVRLRMALDQKQYYVDYYGVATDSKRSYYLSPRAFLDLDSEMKFIKTVKLPEYWKIKQR